MQLFVAKRGFFFGFVSAFVVSILVFIGYMTLSEDVANAKKVNFNMENTLYMDLKDGRVVIRMLPDVAPKHVARIKQLVREGFYDGLTFHRVIDNFMAQGGDPLGNGTGGSGVKIPAEFTKKYSHKRGVVSMARASEPNSADSQFFICTADATYLDGQYTIWGYVVEGMEFVDNIKKGDVIRLNVILLPWGYSTSKNDDNVINVRNDTCFDPYKITPVVGTKVEDAFIPSVRAENGTATFKLSGGRNNAAVRVYGFENYSKPTVTFKTDGEELDIALAGKNGYDGYQVYRDEDGTYSFSFVVDMDAHPEYEITVTQ